MNVKKKSQYYKETFFEDKMLHLALERFQQTSEHYRFNFREMEVIKMLKNLLFF